MLIIGCHVGFNKDKQIYGSLMEALSYNANTFMFYTGAPQNTVRIAINDEMTVKALNLMKEEGIDYRHVIVHAPYIINLANNQDPTKYQFAKEFLRQEVERCEQLGITRLVLHPGSHVGGGIDAGIFNIVNALNEILIDRNVTILLETMAGKGTEVGSTIDEIKRIIDGVENKDRIGICLDTCHLNDSGYDISNFDQILDEIDQKIGLSYVGCIHVNDSKNAFASHKDRHENFGFGTIGFDNLIKVIYNKRLENVPKILETPYIDKQYPPYKAEIEMIRNKQFDINMKDKISE